MSKEMVDCFKDALGTGHLSASREKQIRKYLGRNAKGKDQLKMALPEEIQLLKQKQKAEEIRIKTMLAQAMATAKVLKKVEDFPALPSSRALSKVFGNDRAAAIARKMFGSRTWRAAMSLYVRDPTATAGKAGMIPIETDRAQVFSAFLADMGEAVSQVVGSKRKTLWRSDKKLMRDAQMLARGADEAGLDPAARGVMDAMSKARNNARQMLRDLGLNIEDRADYLSDQTPDVAKWRDLGTAEEFINIVRPLLDPEAMYRKDGSNFLNDDEGLTEMLAEIYDNVVGGGLNRTKGGAEVNVQSRYTDHRVLAFKDSDAWGKYMDTLGQDDPWQGFLMDLYSMAGDIAFTRQLGPEYHMAHAALRSMVEAEEAKIGGMRSGFRTSRLNGVYDILTGASNMPQNITVAQIQEGIQNTLFASKLGSAMLVALPSDVFTMTLASASWGTHPMRALRDTIFPRAGFARIQLDNGDTMNLREWGLHNAIVLDSWKSWGGQSSRFQTEAVQFSKYTRMGADATMVASGMGPWTERARMASGLEVLKRLGDFMHMSMEDMAGKSWGARKFEGRLRKAGWTPADWELMRRVDVSDYSASNGRLRYPSVPAIMGSNKLDATQKARLSRLVGNTVESESDFFVIRPDANTRALTGGAQRPGSIGGVTARALSMFKQFPVSIVQRWWGRMFMESGAGATGLALTAGMVGLSGIFGMTAVIMKQLAKGQSLPPMDTAEDMRRIWFAGMLEAGGAGIYGDFLFNAMNNRYGRTFTQTLAGPQLEQFDQAQRLANLARGEVLAHLTGHPDEDKFLFNLVKWGGSLVPGSNLWWLRTTYNNKWMKAVLRMANESETAAMHARQEGYQLQQNPNGHWWRPGE